MLQITCSGTPYEVCTSPEPSQHTLTCSQIGLKHGQEAKVQVSRSMHFYAGLFQQSAQMEWPKVQELALSFEPVMRRKWPAYLEEINGRHALDVKQRIR